jgi:hypothetical protein
MAQLKNPFILATPVAKKLKLLLYGGSGSGKTVAALTFPRVALVDAESGSDLYVGRPGTAPVHILRSKTLSDLETAIAYIEQDNGKTFDTLVIDPITVFYDVQKEATAKLAKDGNLGFREWAKVNNRMKAVYHKLAQLPVHVVVIARESVEYEGEGNNLRKIGVKPDADRSLIYTFDFVIHMNNNHSGTVQKSRGVALGDIKKVDWLTVFEPVSRAYTDGATVTTQDEEAATEATADDMRSRELAEQFVNKWRAAALSDADMLKALGVVRFGEFDWLQADALTKANRKVQTMIDTPVGKAG